MPVTIRPAIILASLMLLTGCAAGSALQPDRAVFSLDNNYQRSDYRLPIEETFDRTVAVFKEAGYRLDVIDRATGQISGQRGATGDKGSPNNKDLKFYAMVMPSGLGGSELTVKIVQVIKDGGAPLFGKPKAEVIVTEPRMYQFLFRRIENVALQPASPAGYDYPDQAPLPGATDY